MSAKISPPAVKRKSLRLPNWSEAGHALQGCGIGIFVGHIFSIVHFSAVTISVVIFCLIVVGGYMITSSKR
jgi:uncharacterized membrane protein YfcA